MRRLPIVLFSAVVTAGLLLTLAVGSAAAAARTVSIGSTAFNPSTATLAPGDSVAFTNDTGTVVSLSYSSNWPGGPGPQTLTPGQTSTRRTLSAVGTYTASASGIGVTSSGRVVVKAPASASPSPRPTRTTPPPTTASPTPARTTPPASPTTPPVATATATTPPTSAAPTQPAATIPTPDRPGAAPTDDPPVLAEGDRRALVQPHPIRRLGLPATLGAVLLLGLVGALVRVLLAHPAARRTG